MEEVAKDKNPSIEDHPVLKEYEDLFGEILRLAPKRDIDVFIDMVLGAASMSKTPYSMSTLELKELQM